MLKLELVPRAPAGNWIRRGAVRSQIGICGKPAAQVLFYPLCYNASGRSCHTASGVTLALLMHLGLVFSSAATMIPLKVERCHHCLAPTFQKLPPYSQRKEGVLNLISISSPILFKDVFICLKGKITEKRRQIFHLRVHSPDGHKDQAGARVKPGAQSFLVPLWCPCGMLVLQAAA